MFGDKQNFLFEKELEKDLKNLVYLNRFENVLNSDLAGVWWVLVHGPIEAYGLLNLQMDHVRPEVWQRHFIHHIQYETLKRHVHVLRQVYAVQLIKHLLKTVHERELTHNHNRLLSPNLLKFLDIGPLEFSLETSSGLLIEEQTSTVGSFAHIISKDETKRLRSLVVAMERYPTGEAEG